MYSKKEVLNEKKKKSRAIIASLIVIIGVLVLILGIGVSVSMGAKNINLWTVFHSIFNAQDNVDYQIVRSLRMPRALAAALVGAFLAICGAIMQGITRNPIAEPSIMGVTQGATFAIAITFAISSSITHSMLMVCSFLGASISGLFIYFLSSRSIKGTDPVKLALAGTAIGTLLISLATAIAMRANLSQQLSFWIAGGFTSANWESVKLLSIVGLFGVLMALIMSPKITILSLGEEIAIGLGEKTNAIRFIGIFIVIFLSGASVSVAGNVGFIGLIVPQIVKGLVGPDYRYIIPCSLILGADLVVFCDIAARTMTQPYETPIGALIALLGVPFFIYLVRKGEGIR